MDLLTYETLNGQQISALDRRQTVVFLPCGVLEQCGLESPLGNKGFSARDFSERAAERMHQASLKGWNFVLYPTVFSSKAKPRVLRSMLLDAVSGLTKNGFKNIVLVGMYGADAAGARHRVVLEEVATRARWQWRARVVSATSRMSAGDSMEKHLDETTPLLEKYCAGENLEKKFRSTFYYIPFYRTDFSLVLILFLYATIFLILVRWSARVVSGF